VKRLILYDHLGQKKLELDVYVEGQDFTWESPTPQAYWLGQILLLDQEAYEKWLQEKEQKKDVSLVSQPLSEPTTVEEEEEIAEIVKAVEEREALENEPETASDTSGGDEGADKTEQPESAEAAPETDTGGDATERDKGHRQSKTSKKAVGSRSKQPTAKSRRGKGKGTNIKEKKLDNERKV